ncbi:MULTISPECIES: hypothetical protein [unclassified Paraburkholderia]|uniref:hypothetical protein n=1 Tax=unclassified Paraburkholderia TaxID=2615204 RepID=UPI002AB11786|nr:MULTISPECIES: hypothetical protein [unclassified Paraburkholderia]
MKKGKPKLTRLDAERLFEGLPASVTKTSSRPENPFEVNPFKESNPFKETKLEAKRADDESTLWKDNLVTLPKAIELPASYPSVSAMREAMVRAWRVRWVREENHSVVAEFPEGWAAVRPPSGPIQLRDSAGVIRALYGWAEDAELRVLPRYLVEAQANSTTGLGSLIVRDRESNRILERSSTWSAKTGTNHPDWNKLSMWLDTNYPHHLDPLRYWKDCEDNSQ